jgi:hypothetical protein
MEEKISMNESIQAGAPDIKYSGGDIRMGGGQDQQGMEIAADQSGIQSQAPEMSMSENVNMQEQMPGGGIADVDMREKVAMAANGGLMGLYNRGM